MWWRRLDRSFAPAQGRLFDTRFADAQGMQGVRERRRDAIVWVTLIVASTFIWSERSSATQSIREGYAEFAGRRLWYVDTGGDGMPVVALHAATGSSLVWEHQIAAFKAAGYRFVAYDRLGFGKSGLAPGANLSTAADDLRGLVNQLGIDGFYLISTAAGGFVALDYAVSHPQRVRALVVANSIGGVQDDEYLALGRRLRPAPQFAAMPPDFRELGPSYRAANPDGTARWLEIEQRSRATNPLPSPQPFRNKMTYALLETIRIPALMITGGADLYSPPPVMRLLASRIKGCQTLVVPEAGHSTYWEQPQVFNEAVMSFIKKY